VDFLFCVDSLIRTVLFLTVLVIPLKHPKIKMNLLLILLQILGFHIVFSAKKWSDKDLARLEREEMELLHNKGPADKPGMVFAHFPSDLSKKETEILAHKFQGQLLAAGIKSQIFETREKEWVVTTFREKDVSDVVKYLREQLEVMKVVVDSREYWQLPKYQKQYEKERIAKQKENQNKPQAKRITKEEEEALKRRAMEQFEKKQIEDERKQQQQKTEL
jgi:hypothetical protein